MNTMLHKNLFVLKVFVVSFVAFWALAAVLIDGLLYVFDQGSLVGDDFDVHSLVELGLYCLAPAMLITAGYCKKRM